MMPQFIAERSRCLVTRTTFPEFHLLLPPTSRAETGAESSPFSHSEAPAAGPRAVIGGAQGRCLGRALHAREGRQHVGAGVSPGGPLAALGLGIRAAASLCPAGREDVVRSRPGAVVRALCWH